MFKIVALALAAMGLLFWNAPSAQAQLTFNIVNQGTATPQMMTGLAQAGALWSAVLKDPITVNIRISASALSGGVIGHTEIFFDPYPYDNVRAALVSDRLSLDDFSSTGALPAAPAFPMLINRTANNPNGVVSLTPYFDTGLGGPGQAGPDNNNTVRTSSANAKALGLIAGNLTGLDGTIAFTSSPIFDFDRSDGIAANRFDFVGIAAHEIGHVLGFSSGVDILIGNSSPPGLNDNQHKFVTTLDLFRFTGRSIGPGGGIGVIDWTGDDTDKYFSVDGGTTPLAIFSRGAIYEEGHWQNDTGIGIMDPTATVGEMLGISNIDARAMDAIGYNRVSTPNLAGDFNFDGVVDAADYVLWRKSSGSQPAYDAWRAHFSAAPGSASAIASSSNMAVPEPVGVLLPILSVIAVRARLRRLPNYHPCHGLCQCSACDTHTPNPTATSVIATSIVRKL